MADCFRLSGASILLAIKAVPGASKSRIAGAGDGRLRIKIAAAAEDGRANAELRAFLAKALDCPRKDIALVAGEKSRLKTVSLPLPCLEKLEKLLRDFGTGGDFPGQSTQR
jgi:uncharacterized protein (TIGR00251 family)